MGQNLRYSPLEWSDKNKMFDFGGGSLQNYSGMATTGNVRYVSNGIGDDSPGQGKTAAAPFKSLGFAVTQMTANNGDIVYVMPGHTETVAAGDVTVGKAGVSIIGLGRGNTRPTFTFSATGSTIAVTAADVYISNLKCVSGVNSLVCFIDVNEGQFRIDNCLFVTGAATEALCFIDLATTYDDFEIIDCTFLQPTDPEGTGAAVNTGGIYCVDSENILVEGCKFRGQFESGIVHNKTTACKGLVVKNCELSNELTVPFLLVVTAEGVCVGCYGATLTAADATEATVWGTIGTIFWIHPTSALGNDSGGGGQLAVNGTAACS